LETWSHDEALAAALKLEFRSDNALPTMIVAVSDKHLLLLLDNCEHGIDAAHPQSCRPPSSLLQLSEQPVQGRRSRLTRAQPNQDGERDQASRRN